MCSLYDLNARDNLPSLVNCASAKLFAMTKKKNTKEQIVIFESNIILCSLSMNSLILDLIQEFLIELHGYTNFFSITSTFTC